MNAAKHLSDGPYGNKAAGSTSHPSRCAVKADLSAPSYSALDRIGSSLRHCFDTSHDEQDCSEAWDDLLKKLS